MKNEACDKKAKLKVSEYLLKILRNEGIKNLGTYQDLYDSNESDNEFYTKFKYKNAYFTVYHNNTNESFISGYFDAVCWLDEGTQDNIYSLGCSLADMQNWKNAKKEKSKKVKWFKNYYTDKYCVKHFEWKAFYNERAATIEKKGKEFYVEIEAKYKIYGRYEYRIIGQWTHDSVTDAKRWAEMHLEKEPEKRNYEINHNMYLDEIE